MIQIKNITPKKIPEIKALIRQGAPYVDVQHDYNYWLLAHYSAAYTLYAEEDGRVIGYVSSFPMKQEENGLFVMQICVEPGYRGQGIGEMLLEELYKRHHQAGKLTIECTICPDNIASQKTFQKLAGNHGGIWEWGDKWFEGTVTERLFRVKCETNNCLGSYRCHG